MPINHVAISQINAVLDKRRPRPISPEWFPGNRQELIRAILTGGGDFGKNYEVLKDHYAPHVPGAPTRSTCALLDSMRATKTDVKVLSAPDDTPEFAVDHGFYVGDIYVLVRALRDQYERGTGSLELDFADARINSSITHANGVAFRVAAELRKK